MDWGAAEFVLPQRGAFLGGFIKVEPEGIATPDMLAAWLSRGVAFVSTLPPK